METKPPRVLVSIKWGNIRQEPSGALNTEQVAENVSCLPSALTMHEGHSHNPKGTYTAFPRN